MKTHFLSCLVISMLFVSCRAAEPPITGTSHGLSMSAKFTGETTIEVTLSLDNGGPEFVLLPLGNEDVSPKVYFSSLFSFVHPDLFDSDEMELLPAPQAQSFYPVNVMPLLRGTSHTFTIQADADDPAFQSRILVFSTHECGILAAKERVEIREGGHAVRTPYMERVTVDGLWRHKVACLVQPKEK